MKRAISLLLILTFVFSVTSIASAKDQSTKDLTFEERAANMYSPLLKKSILNVTHDNKLTTTTYQSIYIPVKDIFKSTAAIITWDGKKKITTIKNQGQELILNFSGNTVFAEQSQVVLPQEWVQLKNGVSTINAFVLTYIFEHYADESDQERVEWEERLEFLDIKQTTGIAGVDRNMHVFVEFND
ncbi:stalk domain-containing protein [Paenibacillus pabuli]|uniref:stalk domain-containing protein n=1 Tax=Paenibacillus pabuli TaxID=1472 RepID=UPI001FFE82F5|nr:stalk domain-containing protein [Paenibacillus pabuli]UPK41435.1 hypothetical protein KET34_19435 [Paenibacillus pabuli]